MKIKYYLSQQAINTENYFKRIEKINFELPWEIEIETLNRCNGKCSFCPVSALQPQRPYAKMPDELFYKIIDELSTVDYRGYISLFSNNEPFLDERIINFQKYTRDRLPHAFCRIYTNGTVMTLQKFIDIIDNLDYMVIDNYSDNGMLQENVRDVQAFIDRGHEEYRPKVRIWMRKENEVLTSRGGLSPNKQGVSAIPVKCILPFTQLIIRPDGNTSMCCNDPLGKYSLGNLGEKTLHEVWYSREREKIRLEMMKNGRKNLELCKNCDTIGGAFSKDYTSLGVKMKRILAKMLYEL